MHRFCKLILIFITFYSHAACAKGVNFSTADIKASKVHYDAKTETVTATGNVFIQMDEYVLSADKVSYELNSDAVYAAGNVRITDKSDKVVCGEVVVFKDKFKKGVISGFAAKLDSTSIVAARIARRLNENEYELDRSVFTSCDMSCNWRPMWQLNARKANVDYNKEQMVYKHVFFEVYGVPIAYLPYFAHPTPNAKARSGVLRPQFRDGSFVMPFYFFIKDNMDFTISPRISGNYSIFEGEFRHKTETGHYTVIGSIGNPELKRSTDPGEISKDRYYIFAKGDFKKHGVNHGFNFKRASDKAYLTNFHRKLDDSLTSKLYANKINYRDYWSIEAMYFQDLRSGKHQVPIIFPSLITQNIFALDQEESILLNVRNKTLVYKDRDNLSVAKTSLDLELQTNLISDNGHIFDFTLANRGDVYLVSFIDTATQNNIKRVWYRSIPEARVKWRYPLFSGVGKYSSVKLEPIVMLVQGRNFNKRQNKFRLIDFAKQELSENNIFSSNRFSGTDFHDYGRRFSYGVNTSMISKYFYIDTFMGQLIHKNNVNEKDNYEYVGNISANIDKYISVFYRFRKDKKLRPIRNEVGVNANIKRLNFNCLYTELHDVNRYFSLRDIGNNRISQISFSSTYQITDAMQIRSAAQFDISKKPHRTLTKTIGVTYLFNCVSIDASISSSFFEDETRGISKNKTDTSFVVGLKVINM